MTRRKKIGLGIGAVAIAVLAAVYVFWWSVPTVQVTTPKRGPAVQAVYATGAVEPVYWAQVSSTVVGRIMEIKFRDNDTVRKGDVLLRLDDREANANLAEKLARLEFLRKELERYAKLSERNFASQQAFQRAASEYSAAQAAIAAARQRLKDLTLLSPLDGQVLRQDGEIGEVVKAGEVLFWIGKCCPLRIEAEVDEEDIPLVKAGQLVLVRADAFPDKVFKATVSAITPKGDPINKNYRVRVTLGKETPLKIGMTTEVNIVISKAENALLVPFDAIRGGAVWVVNGGHAQRTPVKTGIVGDTMVQIVSGLKPMDRIIVNPPKGLADGDRVRAQDAPATDPGSGPVSQPKTG